MSLRACFVLLLAQLLSVRLAAEVTFQKLEDVMQIRDESGVGEPHSATVIFLHGLGDSADGWSRTAEKLAGRYPYIKFLVPTAPKQAVTVNGGRVMNAWYDIEELPSRQSAEQRAKVVHDLDGIGATRDFVERLIANERTNYSIPRSRVIVGGFSQGATVSLFTGLSNAGGHGGDAEEYLAGIIALSGYLPGYDTFDEWGDERAVSELQMLVCHGKDDNIVPFEAAEASFNQLRTLGSGDNLQFESFEGLRHGANSEELRKVAVFIKQQLPEETTNHGELI